ncbi:MAG: hypothetical protein HY075_08445 [Deltaproteobacteria bacterium]|nr:hypothetical protein [Deltaproteobacteria bacterium]
MAQAQESKVESTIKFLSASYSGSVLSLVRIATGFGRAKLSALILGTAGVGMYAQGNQLFLLASAFATLAISTGIINELTNRKTAASPARAQKILSTSFTVHFVTGTLFLIVAFLASKHVSLLVFGSKDETSKCFAVLLAIPFAAFASSHLEAVLFAANRFDLYVRGSIAASILSFVAFIPLVRYYGLNGAFLYFAANASILFVFFLYYAGKLRPYRELFRFGFDLHVLKILMSYSFVMLFSGAVGYASTLLIRREIIARLGLDANGILQVPLAMTSYYTPFLTNPLWARLQPSVSANGDSPESREAFNTILRIIGLFSTAFIVGLLLFGDLLVRLAYSRDFSPSVALMPTQFLGDFFYFIVFATSVYFLAAGRLRAYLAGWLVYYAISISCTLYLLPTLKLRAVPMGYLVSNVVMAAVCLLWLLRAHARPATYATLGLLAACATVIVTHCLILRGTESLAARSAVPLVALAIGALVLKKNGWRKVLLK